MRCESRYCKAQISPQANYHLHTLLRASRDSDSFMETVTVTDQWYIAFEYTEKNLSNTEKFCCTSTEVGVFAIGTTFNLCTLWITDTSYRNKRLVNTIAGEIPFTSVQLCCILPKMKKHLAGLD